MAEFAGTLWPGMIDATSPTVTMVDPATLAAGVPGEINALRTLARLERSDAMGEIIAQKDEFVSYFMGLLNATPNSHPDTYRVLYCASQIALMAAMHFKYKFKRARPAQLYPPLLPPCETPGHASYPSGHATQSRMMEKCMGLVLHNATLLTSNALPGADETTLATDLSALAWRIAHNREIAGFHYRSDTVNGRKLADDIFAEIQTDLSLTTPQLSLLVSAMDDAALEWATS